MKMLATGANDGAELHDSLAEKVSIASETLRTLFARVSLLLSDSTNWVSHRFVPVQWQVTVMHLFLTRAPPKGVKNKQFNPSQGFQGHFVKAVPMGLILSKLVSCSKVLFVKGSQGRWHCCNRNGSRKEARSSSLSIYSIVSCLTWFKPNKPSNGCFVWYVAPLLTH